MWPGISRPGCDSRCLVRMKLVAEFRIEALVRLGDGFRVRVSSDSSARPPPPLPARRSTGTPDHENPGSAGPRVGEGMRHTVWHECERAGIDAVTCVAKNELHGALGHKPLLDVASVDMRRRSRPAGGGLLS